MVCWKVFAVAVLGGGVGVCARQVEAGPDGTATPTTLPASRPGNADALTTRPVPAERLAATRNARVQAPRRGAEVAAPNPIPASVKALLEEFDESQGPNRTLARNRPDFFLKADLQPTADQLWRALDTKHSPNPRADAYVKWQLLSALPATLDEKSVKRLAALYQRAPAGVVNPAVEPRTRSEIESMGSRLRPGSEDQANDKLRDVTDKAFESNRPVFSYREALIERLPMSAGKYVLAFEEIAARAKLGWGSEAMRDNALADIRSWSVSAPANELQLVVQNLQRLRGVESDEYPFRLRADGSGLVWDRRRERVESWDNTVQALITELTSRQRSPGQRR